MKISNILTHSFPLDSIQKRSHKVHNQQVYQYKLWFTDFIKHFFFLSFFRSTSLCFLAESSQRPTSPQSQSRPPQQPQQQQQQPFNFQPQSQFQSRPPQQQPFNFQPPPQPQSQSRPPRPIAQQSQSSPPQQQQQPSNFQASARPKQPIDDGEISLIRQMKPLNSPLGSSGPFRFQSQGKEEEEAKGEGNYENDDYEEGEYQTDSLSSKMKTLATQGFFFFRRFFLKKSKLKKKHFRKWEETLRNYARIRN